MRIIDLPDDPHILNQVAQIVVDAFRPHYPHAWPDLAAGLEEVRESLAPERISRIAVDDDGTVLGWIGGLPEYDGHVWELHPLAVAPAQQRRGIGAALVRDFEEQARARGAVTIMLGTDDEDNQTSLSNVDLYPNVWEHVARIRNLRDHPFGFYARQGYVIVGVVPDANGPGKPDILMAKRVAR